MLENIKRGIMTAFESGSAVRKNQISGINLPARLARCDAAYNALNELLNSKLYTFDDSRRQHGYAAGLELLDDIIYNLTYIYQESSHVSSSVKKTEDPSLPLLISCRKILELLKNSAETSIEMTKNEQEIESFAGALTVAKSRLVNDTIGDMEITLFHCVCELFELLATPMQRGAEQRKRMLAKEDMERYQRSEQEFAQYYSNFCSAAIAP